MSYKIVIDSCGELPESWKTDENIESIPLTLTVEGEDIIDDETFDQSAFEKTAQSPECRNLPALLRSGICRLMTAAQSVYMQSPCLLI